MASVFARGLEIRWFPATQIVRYRSKINIQRPRKPHYERALVLHVAKPFFEKKPELPLYELCLKPAEGKNKYLVEEDQYKNLQGKLFLNWFNNSSTTLFFQTNPIKTDEFFEARVLFKKRNMVLYRCDKKIARLGLQGTKYDAVLTLYEEPSTPVSAAFGTEVNIAAVLKVLKRVPQLILLGGIVENQLLSRAELLEYSTLGDLQNVQAQFVAVLNSFGIQLVQSLTQVPNTLVGQFERYVDLQTEEKHKD